MEKAFTLAEVLLTLAIIGIVAALTIPAVITKVTKDQYVVALRKAYNTLKAVERKAVQEHGEIKNWNTATSSNQDAQQFFDTYFKPYFDIIKECKDRDDSCFADGPYTRLDKTGTWSSLDNLNNPSVIRIMTSDGISFSFTGSAEDTELARVARFWVDVNGRKGPNIIGRDLFGFSLFSKIGIKPHGGYDVDTGEPYAPKLIEANCNTKTGSGHTCAVKILAEGVMSY